MSPQAAPIETDETPEKRQLRLDRLRKLIQQASSKEGDGMQAAWLACATIRKFGLDVVDPELVDSLHKEIHGLRAQLDAAKAGEEWTVGVDFGVPFRPAAPKSQVFTHSSHVTSQPRAAGMGFSPHVSTQPAGPPPKPQGPGGSPMLAPVFINASKFAGRCKQCGKTIHVGDPVQWLKAVGVWCWTGPCYTQWLSNHQAAGGFNPFGP